MENMNGEKEYEDEKKYKKEKGFILPLTNSRPPMPPVKPAKKKNKKEKE